MKAVNRASGLSIKSTTLALTATTLALSLIACSGPAEGGTAAGRFPDRPFSLDVTRIDPCSALTTEQALRRGAESGGPKDVNLGLSSPSKACGWNNFEDGYGYNFQTLDAGAEEALSAPGVNTVETVAGFGAVKNVVDESTGYAGPGIPLVCQLIIDVNEGQAVRVQVQSSNTKSFGNEQASTETCNRAEDLARDVMTTLASQQR